MLTKRQWWIVGGVAVVAFVLYKLGRASTPSALAGIANHPAPISGSGFVNTPSGEFDWNILAGAVTSTGANATAPQTGG